MATSYTGRIPLPSLNREKVDNLGSSTRTGEMLQRLADVDEVLVDDGVRRDAADSG